MICKVSVVTDSEELNLIREIDYGIQNGSIKFKKLKIEDIGFNSDMGNTSYKHHTVKIGTRVIIGHHTEIHKMVRIDNFSKIGNFCFVHEFVNIEKYVNIGDKCEICSESNIPYLMTLNEGSFACKYFIVNNSWYENDILYRNLNLSDFMKMIDDVMSKINLDEYYEMLETDTYFSNIKFQNLTLKELYILDAYQHFVSNGSIKDEWKKI